MVPALAGAAAGQGEIEDLDRRPAAPPRLLVEPLFEYGSKPRPSLTPSPTPIESPVIAIRNVPAGLDTA